LDEFSGWLYTLAEENISGRNMMTRSRWLGRALMIALLGVGVVTAMTAVAEAAMTVKGDTAAWKEIDAALTRLRVAERRPSGTGWGEEVCRLTFAPPRNSVADVPQVAGRGFAAQLFENRLPEVRNVGLLL
jgi:uncharacterized protein YjiK